MAENRPIQHTLSSKEIKLVQDKQKEDTNDLVLSYLALRRLIGIVGILLPLVLVLISQRKENERVIQASISAYYYTSAGDVFVIVNCLLSAFLLSYKGYGTWEKVLLRLASVCGAGLTLFPTQWKEGTGMLINSAHTRHTEVPNIGGLEWHWIFAGIFFLALSAISIFFFTKSRDQEKLIEKATDQWLTQKSWRNIIYISMGILMVVAMVIILVYAVVDPVQKAFGDFSLIFFMETVAVLAFGVSWLTKGNTLFPDKPSARQAKKHAINQLQRHSKSEDQ